MLMFLFKSAGLMQRRERVKHTYTLNGNVRVVQQCLCSSWKDDIGVDLARRICRPPPLRPSLASSPPFRLQPKVFQGLAKLLGILKKVPVKQIRDVSDDETYHLPRKFIFHACM